MSWNFFQDMYFTICWPGWAWSTWPTGYTSRGGVLSASLLGVVALVLVGGVDLLRRLARIV
jgi:hypothetical protein